MAACRSRTSAIPAWSSASTTNASCSTRAPSRPASKELSGIDAILVTHQHIDHVDTERLPVLVDRNPGVRLLAESSVAAELTTLGLTAEALAPGDRHAIGGAQVDVVGALMP